MNTGSIVLPRFRLLVRSKPYSKGLQRNLFARKQREGFR